MAPSGQLKIGQERLDGSVECLRLVDVGGVAGIGDNGSLRPRDLLQHVLRRAQERLVLRPHQHQRRHADMFE